MAITLPDPIPAALDDPARMSGTLRCDFAKDGASACPDTFEQRAQLLYQFTARRDRIVRGMIAPGRAA
jgi:hypothetical protein